MKARLVRIGNSRGVRLPKPLIEQAGLSEHVELQVTNGSIIISNAKKPRAGWSEAAAAAAARGDHVPLDRPEPTRFDEEEWDW